MKPCTILLAVLIICQLAMAQQEDQKYIVKQGTRPRDTFSFSDIYLYPAFNAGKVSFKNGTSGAGKMNYNRFTSEIDFIKGTDTLALADAETMKNVVIGKDVFYYQKGIGFVQIVAETPYAVFARQENISLVDRRRQPNRATSSNTSNGTYNNQITTGAGVASGLALNMREEVDMIYRKKTEYYFANVKARFVKADKKSIVKLYPEKKDALTVYFTEHEVDFHSQEALQELFNIITSQ